jgi:integrase
MPRRAKGPRLYLDPKRREWVIRDGSYFGRTGCLEPDVARAEKILGRYIGSKYKPEASGNPLIADVLLAYGKEHVPHKRSSKNIDYTIGNLGRWWSDKTVADVTSGNCRKYAASKSAPAARRDLETLRAAIGYWHKEYGPLDKVPVITLPGKSEPRDRWLTRKEARRLRHAAAATPHLYRFIVIGLLTGSRSGAIFALRWDWIDFKTGIMLRRPPKTAEDSRKKTPPVRMGRALMRLLKRWKRMDKDLKCPFVVHYDGQPVSRIKRTWAKACKKAKLKDVTPHTLRHTRATWLMQAGVTPWEAAGALGMTPSILETVYGKQHPDWQKRAAEV